MVEQYQVRCHAWVLMDNHYHLVLETPQANLSQALRHLNGIYSQAFNRRYQRVGHLFQGRFRALLVDKETYLLAVCRYVVLNPVRAGLVSHPQAWWWSSYRATAGKEAIPEWLTVEWVLSHFGRGRTHAQRVYRRFVAEGIAQPDSPWTDVRGQIYLGGEAFVERMARLSHDKEAEEIPLPQRDPSVPSMEQVLEQVARAYGQSVEDLVRPTARPSEAGQLAIYGARRVARSSLKEVGRRFGLSYAEVSHRVGAVGHRMNQDTQFRSRAARALKGKIKT